MFSHKSFFQRVLVDDTSTQLLKESPIILGIGIRKLGTIHAAQFVLPVPQHGAKCRVGKQRFPSKSSTAIPSDACSKRYWKSCLACAGNTSEDMANSRMKAFFRGGTTSTPRRKSELLLIIAGSETRSQSTEHACRMPLINGINSRRSTLPETNMMLTSRGSSSGSKSEVVVDCDRDLLLGPEITLRGLNRGVPEQKLDLLEIAAALAAELGTGSAQVMRAEVLDSDLLR